MIPQIKEAMERYKAGDYTLAQAMAIVYAHIEMEVNVCQPSGNPDYQIGFNNCKNAVLVNIKSLTDAASQ